jgi:uncharacterized protein
LFEAWLEEADPDVQIRFINNALAHFEAGVPPRSSPEPRKKNQIIVARSDQTVAIGDSLIPALEWYSATPEFAIRDYSLRQVLADPIFATMDAVEATLPDGCRDCQWAAMCRGGDLENRYSARNGFNNPSVYCQTYKTLYAGICRALAARGYPREEIERRFGALDYA